MNKYTVSYIKSFYNDEKKGRDSKLPIFHREIIRPLSFYITIPFLRLGFSANQVTFLSLFIALLGNAAFAIGTYDSMRIGVLLIIAAIELDFVDGNIARYRKKQSQFGSFLDGSFGFLMYALIPLCLGVGVSLNNGSMNNLGISGFSAIIIGAFLTVLYMFNNYIQWRYKAQLAIATEKRKSQSETNYRKIPVNYSLPVSKYVKNILQLINGFNSNVFIPSLILIFFRLPGVLLLLYVFIHLSSTLIIVARIYRKALHNLSTD